MKICQNVKIFITYTKHFLSITLLINIRRGFGVESLTIMGFAYMISGYGIRPVHWNNSNTVSLLCIVSGVACQRYLREDNQTRGLFRQRRNAEMSGRLTCAADPPHKRWNLTAFSENCPSCKRSTETVQAGSSSF